MTELDDRSRQLRDNLAAVRARIADAARAAGRAADDVTLIVVSKYFPVADVRRLLDLGVTDFGENKDQEASAKFAEIFEGASEQERAALRLHFVGQLQSNKTGHVAAYADIVQSVDRAKIASALAKGAERHGRTLEVMVQVDLDGSDPGRGGALPEQIADLAAHVAGLEHLRLTGLMAVAPRGADPDAAFARLAELSRDLRAAHPSADRISAGMSGDLEQAVRHGATHVRIGSAVLGPRPAV
ncbi:YggS family pyridoxal phosphate-dependent enzyme [Calidifontibacter indicus]|uniref:YggS family pyridoxal phosphate-dependent enzyme n=1 Tax=Calidifontibacter indicus TaxID=419650 RepID=UPI003D75D48C